MEPPLLICAQPFDTLEAHAVAEAVASGLTAAGCPEPDIIELPAAGDVKALLAEHRFDQRMRAAFAVVICTEHLRDGELRGTFAAEIATSARQTGVGCHAICAENAIEAFTARIYDLQTIRTAATRGQLRSAAGILAGEL